MPQVATLPAPDRGELDQALKKQKSATKAKERQEHLTQRDNFLQRIPPLPEYQPMIIEDCTAVSHLPSDLSFTPSTVFGLIWTTTVWKMLCANTNLYATAQTTQKSQKPTWTPTTVPELKIFVAITEYMGIFHFPTIHDYWRTDGIALVAAMIVDKMARDRYVHCSDPNNEDSATIGTGRYKQPVWYKKMLTFADEIWKFGGFFVL